MCWGSLSRYCYTGVVNVLGVSDTVLLYWSSECAGGLCHGIVILE